MGFVKKVAMGNLIAAITFADVAKAAEQGKGIAIENPTNSFIWDLEEPKLIADMDGMISVEFCNCMFRGGKRNKKTSVLTNVREIADRLRGRMCCGKEVCDRTGQRHLTWDPKVSNDIITKFQTRGRPSTR